MSEQETWEAEDENALRSDDSDDNAYQAFDPDGATNDSLSDDSLSDDSLSDDYPSDDDEVDEAEEAEADESGEGSDLLGFPPGKTKADYVPINGGLPPFGDWQWPPDFTDADKATFWDGATTGSEDYAYMAAYNRVSAFNNPYADSTGKAGSGMSVENFQQQESMYSYYNPSDLTMPEEDTSSYDSGSDTDTDSETDTQAPARAQAVELSWDDVDWGFVQKLNESILKETAARGQQPFWQVGGGLLIGWEHPSSYRALFETLAGGEGSGDAPHGTIDVVSRGSLTSRGEIQVTGSSDQAAFKKAVREFSQKNITFL